METNNEAIGQGKQKIEQKEGKLGQTTIKKW